MQVKEIKVLLEIILEELSGSNDNTNIYQNGNSNKENLENLELLSNSSSEDIDIDLLKNGIKRLLSQRGQVVNNNEINNIVYKGLNLIFSNTTQDVRFLYLSDILVYFYNILIQKLIELKQHLMIMSLEDFNILVRNLLPYTKLDILMDCLKSSSSELENISVATKEVYECILYPKILREDCYQIIKNKLKDDSIKFLTYDMKKTVENNGVVGEYFKLKIIINQDQKICYHYFFLKYIPSSGLEPYTNMAELGFVKEDIFYNKFIPMIETLGYPEFTDFLPKCYMYIKNDFLVFDDISVDGYESLNICKAFTYEQLSLAIKCLAKMHSCTLLFEQKVSKILGYEVKINKYFSRMVPETILDPNGKTATLVTTYIDGAVYLFEKYLHLLQKKEIDKLKKISKEEYYKLFHISSTKFQHILAHGDLWCNNLLYKNDGTNCLLIDFATLRLCPPGFEYSFFLHINTDKSTRDLYGKKLFNDYYGTIDSLLDKQNISVTNLLSQEEILKSISQMKLQVHCMTICYLQQKLVPDENDPTAGDDSLADHLTNTKSRIAVIERTWDSMKSVTRIEEILFEGIELLEKLYL